MDENPFQAPSGIPEPLKPSFLNRTPVRCIIGAIAGGLLSLIPVTIFEVWALTPVKVYENLEFEYPIPVMVSRVIAASIFVSGIFLGSLRSYAHGKRMRKA